MSTLRPDRADRRPHDAHLGRTRAPAAGDVAGAALIAALVLLPLVFLLIEA